MTNKNNPIKFGTDGWRGIIARDFTIDNVQVCAQALAEYLKQTGLAPKGLVIGYDTRFASENFATAAAEVICGNGIKVYLCSSATPTPVVSYGVVAHKAAGAIMITASHNPGIWNGFKIKSQEGASAPVEMITEIEKNVDRVFASEAINKVTLENAAKNGLLENINLAPLYIEHIGKLVDINKIRQANYKIAIDPMFGAGIGYFERILGQSNLTLDFINNERNPVFPGMIRPEPVEINLKKLAATIKHGQANIGLATDGDADRLGIVDENGTFMTPLQVFAMLCLYLLEIRGERGLIVKSLTTTSMIYRIGELFGVPVKETKVGFKYIAPLMISENALCGGEESGGYGFRGHVPERDGILAGLYFLDLMLKTGKTPSQLLSYLYSKVGHHEFKRIDLQYPDEKRGKIEKIVAGHNPAKIAGIKLKHKDTTDGFRFVLEDDSWLLIRFSGTEPVLRIYTETNSPQEVEELLKYGKELTGV